MSELAVITNIEAERTDLALHVDLCAQRYNQLIGKLSEVDTSIASLTIMCEEIKENVQRIQSNTQSTHLRWATSLIGLLSGVCVSLVLYIVTH